MAYYDGTNAPTLTLEMLLVTIWTPITVTDVRSVSVRRGRTREDQNFQPGTLTVILDNRSGNYDSDNQSSTYFVGGRTYLTAGTQIRLKATWSSTTYTLYTGYIEDVQVDVSLDPVTTIIATDALAMFARTKLQLPALPGIQTVQNRITTILGNYNVGYTNIDIGSGARQVVVQDETQFVLDLLDEAAACEFGRFWIDRNGTAVFRNWNDLPTLPFTFNLSDSRATSTIEYDLINTEPGSRYRINSVTINGNNGSTATGSNSDSASIAAYGTFNKDYSLPLNSNADCTSLAAQIVGRFSDPFTRVNHIEFEGVGIGSLWSSVLQADLNYLVNVSRITVDNRTLQIGGFIEGLNFDITPNSWRYSLDLSDYSYTTNYWLGYIGNPTDSSGATPQALASAIDSSGALFAIGRNPQASKIMITKHDVNGNLIWQRYLGAISGSPGAAIAVDSTGNVYVAGNYTNSSSGTNIVVAKYDTLGNLQWQKTMVDAQTASIQADYGLGMTIDSSNNVYITGYYVGAYVLGQPQITYLFIVGLSSSGSTLWQKYLRDTNTYPSTKGYAITCDSSANLYVTGNYKNASGGFNVITAKYNSSGTLQWQRSLADSNTAATQNDVGYGIAVDLSGNVYIAGNTIVSGRTAGFIAKYNSSGTLQWQRTLASTTGVVFLALTIDNVSNYLYVTGYYQNASSGTNLIFAKYDTSGTIQWQNSLADGNTAASQNTRGFGITNDGAGNVYINGAFYTTSTINSINNYLVGKLPDDGSRTGTYTFDSVHKLTYATSALTDAAGTLTGSTPSLTSGTSALTISTGTLNVALSSIPNVTIGIS